MSQNLYIIFLKQIITHRTYVYLCHQNLEIVRLLIFYLIGFLPLHQAQ